jgi:hypothetical protein
MFPLLLAGLFQAVTSQSSCTILPKDSVCGPEFEGFPIATSVESLNENMAKNIIDVKGVEAQLTRQQQCNSNIGNVLENLRYQVSMHCAISVTSALERGCASPKILGMCEFECSIAVGTFEGVISNGAVCPRGNLLAPTASLFRRVCQTSGTNIRTKNADCVLAALERKHCGIGLLIKDIQTLM